MFALHRSTATSALGKLCRIDLKGPKIFFEGTERAAMKGRRVLLNHSSIKGFYRNGFNIKGLLLERRKKE